MNKLCCIQLHFSNLQRPQFRNNSSAEIEAYLDTLYPQHKCPDNYWLSFTRLRVLALVHANIHEN
jgi:hypothetical protein